jgi:hypothetical protein
MEQDLESCDSIENFITDYKMMMTLGEESFSVVKMAYDIATLTCVAIKHLRKVKKYYPTYHQGNQHYEVPYPS